MAWFCFVFFFSLFFFFSFCLPIFVVPPERHADCGLYGGRGAVCAGAGGRRVEAGQH